MYFEIFEEGYYSSTIKRYKSFKKAYKDFVESGTDDDLLREILMDGFESVRERLNKTGEISLCIGRYSLESGYFEDEGEDE